MLTLLVEATRFIEALPPNPSGKPGKTRKLARSAVDNPKPGDAASPTLTDAEASRAEARIRASSLPQFLARELKNCSFMNMTARSAYYSSLMRTARALAESRCGDCLLVDGAAGNASALVKTLEDAAVQARIYLRSIDESEVAARWRRLRRRCLPLEGIPRRRIQRRRRTGHRPPRGAQVARHGQTRRRQVPGRVVLTRLRRRRFRKRDREGEKTCEPARSYRVGGCARAFDPRRGRLRLGRGARAGVRVRCFRRRRGGEVSTRGKGKGRRKGKKAAAARGLEEAYQSALRPFTYDSAELIAAGHAYAGERGWTSDLVRTSPRVAKEIAGLAGGALPLNRSSSAFVRVDDAKSVIWSIMITGPEDTPYDGGCFVFDAFFPSRPDARAQDSVQDYRRRSVAPTRTCTRTARCASRCSGRGRAAKARRGTPRCPRCCRSSCRSSP